MKEINQFEAFDGTVFESKEECEKYELLHSFTNKIPLNHEQKMVDSKLLINDESQIIEILSYEENSINDGDFDISKFTYPMYLYLKDNRYYTFQYIMSENHTYIMQFINSEKELGDMKEENEI